MFVFHEFVLDGLFGVGGPRAQLRQAVDHVGEEIRFVALDSQRQQNNSLLNQYEPTVRISKSPRHPVA